MDAERLFVRLEKNPRVIAGLVEDLPTELVSWKPSLKAWSILEVMAHLLDEEREDFRQRIEYVLHRPGEAWPPIDPQGWVEVRRYATRNLADTLREFLDERHRSVTWLRGLESPDWEASYRHPVLGELRAGDLLASWLAHDLLHIRQLNGLHWQHHSHAVRPYETNYAGEW